MPTLPLLGHDIITKPSDCKGLPFQAFFASLMFANASHHASDHARRKDASLVHQNGEESGHGPHRMMWKPVCSRHLPGDSRAGAGRGRGLGWRPWSPVSLGVAGLVGSRPRGFEGNFEEDFPRMCISRTLSIDFMSPDVLSSSSSFCAYRSVIGKLNSVQSCQQRLPLRV
jgi:hypothetical protein